MDNSFRNLEGDVSEWLFSAAPPELSNLRTPWFTRTLSQWLNLRIDTGFRLERLAEPRPSDEAVRVCPVVQDVPDFLHIRVRKPGRIDPLPETAIDPRR